MTITVSMAEQFGGLLRKLKDTYGWPALRAMSAQDLIVLLERSCRSPADYGAVRALDPWMRSGLRDLLAAPPGQRQRHWPKLSIDLGCPADVLEASAKKMDRSLALSRADRRDLPTTSVVAVDQPRNGQTSRITPLLLGATAIGLAGGLALTIQIGRYRQEVMRQQQASREQKAELDRVKRQLSEREQSAGTSESESPTRSATSETLPRPALPESAPDPPSPGPTPSSASASEQTVAAQWNGCERDADSNATAPQSGEVWWPVTGPLASLEAVRRHCRADAFRNRDGNVQVASFRDRSAAASFAEQLSADSQHPYTFYVGEPSRYD